MLTNLLFPLVLAWPTPPPRSAPSEVVLVQSRMAPLTLITPGPGPSVTVQPLGPMSPRGFGLASGRLRHLATSTAAGVAVVDVSGPDGGGLFALPLAGGPPRLLAKTTSLGLDLALSPDGLRLLYVDNDAPVVVTLSASAAGSSPVIIATHRPAPAHAPQRIERPRWLDDATIAYEGVITQPGGRITTTLEAAPADGSARATLLVKPSGGQDRLAAVVGERVLAYRDGTLHVFAEGALPKAIGTRFAAGVVAPWPNLLPRLERVLLALGESGVTRKIALATIDAAGTMQTLTARRTTYLDPLVSRDRGYALWSIETPSGFVVERVALDGSGTRVLTAAHKTPIELVAFAGDSAVAVGCRGGDVVAFDSGAGGASAPRVLASAPANPSCTVRFASAEHVVFERKTEDDWRLELLPLGGGPALTPPPGASWVAAAGRAVIAQGGWEGVATLVSRSAADPVTPVTIVPWQTAGIADAHRTNDGATVVLRIGKDPRWHAVRLDRPGVLVDVTGPDAGDFTVALSDDRLIGYESAKQRFVSWRLDGRDAGRPALVLGGVMAGPYADGVRRVTGIRPDGSVVSAPIDGSERDRPTVVLRGQLGRRQQLQYDPVHERLVMSALVDGRLAIVAAGVRGEDVDRPRVLGHPRPSEDSDLERVEVTTSGDVWLHYATRYTAMPHPSGSDVLAADGSGFMSPSAPLERHPRSRPLALERLEIPDDPYGAETHTTVR